MRTHQQIVEEHFDRCLKEQGLNRQEAVLIASTRKEYDVRLCAALKEFTSSNPYSIGKSDIRSLIGIYAKKTRILLRIKTN